MKKVKYVDPFLFIESEIDVDDFLVQVSDEIQLCLAEKYENPADFSLVTPKIVSPDGTVFIIGIMNHRVKYKITIEKFKSEQI